MYVMSSDMRLYSFTPSYVPPSGKKISHLNAHGLFEKLKNTENQLKWGSGDVHFTYKQIQEEVSIFFWQASKK